MIIDPSQLQNVAQEAMLWTKKFRGCLAHNSVSITHNSKIVRPTIEKYV